VISRRKAGSARSIILFHRLVQIQEFPQQNPRIEVERVVVATLYGILADNDQTNNNKVRVAR
jgi:hypothetical protein